jgi:hypothetical protein
MATTDPGIPKCRTSAAMWAYRVSIYHRQLLDAVEAYAKARLDEGTRNSILKASLADQTLMGPPSVSVGEPARPQRSTPARTWRRVGTAQNGDAQTRSHPRTHRRLDR